jgi:hypothetical protein
VAAAIVAAVCIGRVIRVSRAVPSARWARPTVSGSRFVVPIAVGGPPPIRSVFWDDGFISVS